VVEFAWAWIDEATAEWALKRLPASSPLEKPSWLGRCCWEWARGTRRNPSPRGVVLCRVGRRERVPQPLADVR
jgi:hypothetical protein